MWLLQIQTQEPSLAPRHDPKSPVVTPNKVFFSVELFYYFIKDKLLCAHCAVQTMGHYQYLWRPLYTHCQLHSSFSLRRAILSRCWRRWVLKEFGSDNEFRFCTCWIWGAWRIGPGEASEVNEELTLSIMQVQGWPLQRVETSSRQMGECVGPKVTERNGLAVGSWDPACVVL